MKQIVSLISLLFYFGFCFSATIQVYPNAAGTALKLAVDKAKAHDVLLVHAGIYFAQELILNKQLHLKGVGSPIINGQSKGNMVIIKAAGCIFEGFVVKNSGFSGYNDVAALRLLNTNNVIVRNNKFYNNFFAIYSQNSSKCIIQNNVIKSNAISELLSANAIHCWKNDSVQILGNTISGHRDGIYFEFVTNSIIKGNHSEANVRYGLHFMFSHHNIYYGNTFKNNGAGVAVMYTKFVTMINNTFIQNWGSSAYGLLLKDITDSEIHGNLFLQNTCAIFMEGSNRITAKGNTFKNNGWALKIQSNCSDNSIVGNNFINNSFDVSTNGDLVLNSFEGNYWDHYTGYDLNRDGIGDVPYRPVSMYSMIIEKNPTSLMLYRSLLVQFFDQAEKIIPGFTPENLKDNKPKMKALKL